MSGELGCRLGFEKLKKLTELALETVKQQISYVNEKYAHDKYWLEIKSNLSSHKELKAQVKNVFNLADESIPYGETYFLKAKNLLNQHYAFSLSDAEDALEYILEVIEDREAGVTKVKEMSVFESAEDRVRQAGLAFLKNDFASVFHSLNIALELVLKEKAEILANLTEQTPSNVIEELVKEKVNGYKYFDAAKKRVVRIDNKIKHRAYTPKQTECISALRAMEDLMSKL